MDGIVKIEETVMEIDGEELDIMHSAEELDVKTEMTSDTDGKIERIKHENWGCDDSPIIPINFVKIEKDEPEMCVEDPVHYKDTVQLNEELNIKNHICADPKSASPDIKRIKTEHDTEKRNESDLSTANMAAKADSDASTLHTEFDFKDESHPSTWAREHLMLKHPEIAGNRILP
ncbi:unnamed protein product [Callosobruchus maculatus]|uniref:Uncharacterized protein n=1 Tax=Callosobruchus maculatus TaxID=64391 RepID=A0A653BXI4_CALMS|nr:unnamed protein product [Callosobruchus maculatus]